MLYLHQLETFSMGDKLLYTLSPISISENCSLFLHQNPFLSVILLYASVMHIVDDPSPEMFLLYSAVMELCGKNIFLQHIPFALYGIPLAIFLSIIFSYRYTHLEFFGRQFI